MLDVFLPGVPVAEVTRRLMAAGGNEIESGKLAHPESSAALAVNAFGWFIERPSLFPPLPGANMDDPVERVEIEYSARFPWAGGRHPWLDAAIFTSTRLIGVESKRYEPFRDAKSVSFSSAYDQPVWGSNMGRYSQVSRALRSGELKFDYLDAAQLVKHAYGLVTDGNRLAQRPTLFYIFAEPIGSRYLITSDDHARHRTEISEFAAAIAGDTVDFGWSSYADWLDTWSLPPELSSHAQSLRQAFDL
jgi:hypothetical protein